MSAKGIAILTGAGLIQADTDSPIIAHTTQTVQASEDGSITLEGKNPETDYDIYMMLLDNNGEMSGVPVKIKSSEVAAGKITNELIKKGDAIMVDYYTKHTQDAQQLEITADKFAGYYYLEGSTLFRREMDGVDLPAEIIIPKVKIQSNFTFAMSSNGDPSSFDFTMDAFPDYIIGDKTKKQLAAIQILTADDNYDLTGNGGDDDSGALNYERYDYYDDEAQIQDGGSYFTVKEEGPITDDDKKTVPSE